ncbi:MAG: hypothetical protein ABIP06_11980 [Pyrinomonadaceae bacterium]
MESLEQHNAPKKGINKIFIVAFIVAAVAIAGIIYLISLRPSMQQQVQETMESAYREGSPEFALLTKKIVIQTDENRTMESPIGLGTILMIIGGQVKNLTGKTITGLEINVSVIDTFGNSVKNKNLIVVPNQYKKLETNEVADVTVRIDGFDPKADRANIRWKVVAIKTE